MKEVAAQWSLIPLCFSMAAAIGGGLYESIVLTPLWSRSPPSSFSIIQAGTGVPLQRFWIPVHAAITVFIILALVLTWRDMTVRRLLLIALVSYVIMRVWSGLCEEMIVKQGEPFQGGTPCWS
jgi:Flp pilus assembly protein TadB